MQGTSYLYIGLGVAVVGGLIAAGVYFLFSFPEVVPAPSTDALGSGSNRSTVTPTTPTSDGENQPVGVPATQKAVFNVANGPIVSAAVIQTLRPTTTVARYVQQNNGHVFDLMLDSAGAVPKSVSNITIPGIFRALWAKGGAAALLQYLDAGVIKSVYLGFPTNISSTSTQPVAIKFLPDGILDMAVSPNGASVAYLLKTTSGVAGYVATADGTGGKQLFTLHLSEILMSWPSPNTLLLYSKTAAGLPGIAFSVSVTSGAVVSLLYAPELTLTADETFSYLVYRTGAGETYAREVESGLGTSLSYDPYPEKCRWGSATTTLYCAAPAEYVPADYLDLWHLGLASVADALYKYDLTTGIGTTLAIPGGAEGGVPSAIDTLTISADGRYLLFVKRGDRSLWGVRLGSTP